MENKIDTNKSFLGIFLVILGILLYIIQTGIINWENFWPLIMIIFGMLFIIGFLINRQNFGLLLPGTILLIVGLMFFYMIHGNWHTMDRLWPVFILAPGIGFLVMQLVSPASNKFWIPGGILTGLSFIFLSHNYHFFIYIPLIFILIGIILIASSFKTDKSKNNEETT